jgi:hypothetical protein
VRVLRSVGFVDGVVAAHHADQLTHPRLLGGVEHDSVLTDEYVELYVVGWFHSAAVHLLGCMVNVY